MSVGPCTHRHGENQTGNRYFFHARYWIMQAVCAAKYLEGFIGASGHKRVAIASKCHASNLSRWLVSITHRPAAPRDVLPVLFGYHLRLGGHYHPCAGCCSKLTCSQTKSTMTLNTTEDSSKYVVTLRHTVMCAMIIPEQAFCKQQLNSATRPATLAKHG